MKKPLLILGLLTLTISTIITPIQTQAALPLTVNSQQLPSLAPMLEKITPAVVSISVEGTQLSKRQIPEQFRFFLGPDFPEEQAQERPFKGLGSGVILDAQKGYIVTNHHVINNAKEILVQLHDGREYKAELIGSDEMSDIALLKLEEAKDLTQIVLSDSDDLRVGDFSVAIGNPFGLGQTVTSGIVSALGRSGLNLENFENFIQTDAAINSGNSGGALVNLNGELIGINTAILGPNGGNVGIGFAIPSNMVRNLSEQIIEFGHVKRGILGVQGGELTAELAEAFDYDTNHGAFVSQVLPDGAAEKAGIKAGDILISLNGKNIQSFGELRAKVATLGAGKKITLGLIRDGKEKTVIATLAEADQIKTKAENLHEGLKGAQLKNTASSDPIKGVKVSAIQKGSMAQRYGLQKDDIIIGVNRTQIKNLQQFRQLLDSKPPVLALNIQRGKQTLYLVIR
ncbi:Do family serine endopeptidase [Aliivibrio logei]|uniref:Do family serine endopeptidase n=1 Tax=Aliivibrio logei TaxID=688 RepID=UPI0003A7BC87|nr:Do family serine endopeptidase [Aliivibrio logei]